MLELYLLEHEDEDLLDVEETSSARSPASGPSAPMLRRFCR
jgi:hypothetical protein